MRQSPLFVVWQRVGDVWSRATGPLPRAEAEQACAQARRSRDPLAQEYKVLFAGEVPS